MKTFYTDGGGKFISIKLITFFEKRSITLKYAAPYMHEKNSLVERR